KYIVNNHVYPLHRGQGFLIEPNVLTRYEADPIDPWTYIWIGFDGTDCTKHLTNIGLNEQRIFHSTKGDKLKEIVLEMFEYPTFNIQDEYLLQSLLYKFFSFISDQPKLPQNKNSANENEYVGQ